MIDPLSHAQLSSTILKGCFEVINGLGVGFLEIVYKNALSLTLREKGLLVEIEKPFEVHFKQQIIGLYKADLVVENLIVIELKCCTNAYCQNTKHKS